jgi:hypothetical protein
MKWIYKKIIYAVRAFKLNKDESFFLNHYKQSNDCNDTPKHNTILIQTPMEHYHLIAFSQAIEVLNRNYNYKVVGLWPYSLKPLKKNRRVIEIIYQRLSAVIFLLLRKKWAKLYRVIGVSKMLNLENLNYKERALCHREAKVIFSKIEKKSDVLKINFKGVCIGDLIYDSYIRLRSEKTVDIDDHFLYEVIYHSLASVKTLDLYFSQSKVNFFLTSYTSYIQHGVAVRVALKHGVKVFSEGNFVQFFKPLSNSDAYHTPFFRNYKNEFKQLECKKSALEKSENELKDKFSGAIDKRIHPGLSTSVNSVYHDVRDNFKGGYDGVVFLHDFFDAPHAWGEMMFEDFWEWSIFTLSIIEKFSLNIAVKPHPNDIGGGVLELKKLFPNLDWIDSSVSNKAIFGSKIKFGISMYGSVLYELAYHGIVPISAAENPTSSFGFVIQPKTKDEYKNLLLSLSDLKALDNMDKEVLEFYYMHHFSHENGIDTSLSKLNISKFGNDSCVLKSAV